ncbi:MAG: hypothetical protein ACRD1L_07175 [Terriglobales bacterium]
MKSWVLPVVAVGAVVFLMTKPGRELQDEFSDHFGDWMDSLMRSNHRLQHTLNHLQTVLERCNRTLQKVAN